MIRRKFQEINEGSFPIEKNLFRQYSRYSANQPKYSYQVEQMDAKREMALNSYLEEFNHHSSQAVQRDRVFNQQDGSIRKACQSMLRRDYLYEGDIDFKNMGINLEKSKHQGANLERNRRQKLRNERIMSKCEHKGEDVGLCQRNPFKELNGIKNNRNDLSFQQSKTIRKKDELFTCNSNKKIMKNEATKTDRYLLKVEDSRDKHVFEDDLDSRYEQIWSCNQQFKSKGLGNENSSNITLRNIESGDHLIVNARSQLRKNCLRELEREHKEHYCKVRDGNQLVSMVDPRYSTCINSRKSSFDSRSGKKALPQSRSRLNYSGYVQKQGLKDKYLEWSGVPSAANSRALLGHEADLKLRRVQEVNEKISRRIIQLTSVIEQMRGES